MRIIIIGLGKRIKLCPQQSTFPDKGGNLISEAPFKPRLPFSSSHTTQSSSFFRMDSPLQSRNLPFETHIPFLLSNSFFPRILEF